MSKKVLVISASPRKGGNSDILCDEFVKGAKEAGNNAEKIFLKDKNINCCTGCGYCVSNGYKDCFQKDDMSELVNKMIEADVIAMATPVYFYTMNAQMKMFIDRCCSKYTSIKNKEFYFIATAADGNKRMLDRTFDGFRGFLACLDGSVEKQCIYAPGVWQKGEVKNTPAMQEAYNAGLSL